MTRPVVGWDIGGAHLKACLVEAGRVVDIRQWMCPLWQGLDRLGAALAQALGEWPAAAAADHALTMSGEMADCFADREEGVHRIVAEAVVHLGPVSCFAGDAGWVGAPDAASHWAQIASANWLATAWHAARHWDEGLLVDIGSTTTDIIAFRTGAILTTARTDAQRLATGELVYHGVVRTPLCAFAPRVPWRGETLNVMNEFFATAADVYRLTGELDSTHDVYPPADGGAKDPDATRRRLMRMIGLDARDAPDADIARLARWWRQAQVDELAGQLGRVRDRYGLSAKACVVTAGCGGFLVPSVLDSAQASAWPLRGYAQAIADVPAAVAPMAQVCAPCVAVALLYQEASRRLPMRCGS